MTADELRKEFEAEIGFVEGSNDGKSYASWQYEAWLESKLCSRDSEIRNTARWVPIEERLPDYDEYLVLYNIGPDSKVSLMGLAELDEEGWYVDGNNEIVTHWLDGVPPLPESQKEGE